MPIVLITPESFIDVPGPYIKSLTEAGFDIRYPKDRTFARGLCSEQETIDELSGIVAVIAGGEVIGKNVFAALPELRVVARSGVGFDRVDISAATAHNVPVTITPNSNHEAVAEQTLALLFAFAKSVVVLDKETRAGGWRRLLTRPVRGSTLGIFGLGRIGRSTALRGIGVGMNVIATESYPDEQFVREHGIELVDFDTLLAQSDYVSIHCPLNDETYGLFNKDVFAKMKPGSVLLNTARGDLVVEADLIAALHSGHLAGAGLDVFQQEPVDPANPLFKLDQVVVSPHLAGTDTMSMEAMGIEAADCIIKLSRNEWPEGCVVNDELKSTWKW